MRDNGGTTVPEDQKMFKNKYYIDVRGELLGPPHGTTTAVVISKRSDERSFENTTSKD